MSINNLRDKFSSRSIRGEIEFIIKDKRGRIVERIREPNLIKIFAKEMLSHRLAPSNVWDPDANSGVGAWVSSGVDLEEDFSAKYIVFGASFDANGVPLDSDDDRYYTTDPITQSAVPLKLQPGAFYEGGLINPIPVAEPERPLKRVESVTFEPTYQPSGSPFLSEDVRAMNNIVVFETTLPSDEYNGHGTSASDFYTITEVALVGAKELDAVGACDCDPHELFLEGRTADGLAMAIDFSGGDVVTIDSSEAAADIAKILAGDQVKIVDLGDSVGDTIDLDSTSPFYLVTDKSTTGRELTLDRTPTDASGTPLTGRAGIFRDTMRIYSHRILHTPVKKSADFEIIVRWRIIFS